MPYVQHDLTVRFWKRFFAHSLSAAECGYQKLISVLLSGAFSEPLSLTDNYKFG